MFVGLVLIWAGAPPVGFILGLFGGTVLTSWYLNWVQAFGGLLAALAVTVALAIANGERHRGRYSYIRR